MAFKLKKGEFRVECRFEGCPFDHIVKVDQNIMGYSEDDVENEAKKIALSIAKIKHDSLYGRNHPLHNPTVKKASVLFQAVGKTPSKHINQEEAVKYQEYNKDDIILKKGELASTICEVVKGSAYVEKKQQHLYKPGDTFGAAALLINQVRTTDVLSAEDGTTIAFYNLKQLSKKDPRKAKELYTEAMEDVFDILSDLDKHVDSLETELEREKMISLNRLERLKVLENEMEKVNKGND